MALPDFSPDIDLALNDLGPLAWVLDELRKAVGSATRALRRFEMEAEALPASERGQADATHLRLARQQLHQAAGAKPSKNTRVMVGPLQLQHAIA